MDSLSSLLVHVDASAHAARRVEVAAALAQAHGAALRAVYAVRPMYTQYLFSPTIGGEVVAQMQQADEERQRHAHAAVEQALARCGAQAEWLACLGEPTPGLAREALFSDLVVLGQHDPTSPTAGDLPRSFVESVVIESGRPALVLPHTPAVAGVGHVALVAWKPTREAARAVAAALPLLRRASRVQVALWQEPGMYPTEPAQVLAYLAQHGVRAEAHGYGTESHEVGEYLLALASDLGADLLVMGCYGHRRAREWALGGASRSVLASMTIPVLMAH